MSKVSIDLKMPDGAFISPESLTAIVAGILQTLQELGRFGNFIEVFRVTFAKFSDKVGPVILVHFKGPIGESCSYGTDFRFIGESNVNPSSKDIIKHFASDNSQLRYLISEHLDRCRVRIRKAQYMLG